MYCCARCTYIHHIKCQTKFIVSLQEVSDITEVVTTYLEQIDIYAKQTEFFNYYHIGKSELINFTHDLRDIESETGEATTWADISKYAILLKQAEQLKIQIDQSQLNAKYWVHRAAGEAMLRGRGEYEHSMSNPHQFRQENIVSLNYSNEDFETMKDQLNRAKLWEINRIVNRYENTLMDQDEAIQKNKLISSGYEHRIAAFKRDITESRNKIKALERHLKDQEEVVQQLNVILSSKEEEIKHNFQVIDTYCQVTDVSLCTSVEKREKQLEVLNWIKLPQLNKVTISSKSETETNLVWLFFGDFFPDKVKKLSFSLFDKSLESYPLQKSMLQKSLLMALPKVMKSISLFAMKLSFSELSELIKSASNTEVLRFNQCNLEYEEEPFYFGSELTGPQYTTTKLYFEFELLTKLGRSYKREKVVSGILEAISKCTLKLSLKSINLPNAKIEYDQLWKIQNKLGLQHIHIEALQSSNIYKNLIF